VPLRLVAAGLLLVLLDLRIGGVDLLPDVLGLALVAVGLRRLGAGDPFARPVLVATSVAAVLSLGDLVRVPVVAVVYDVVLTAVPALLANYLAVRAARATDVAAENTWLRMRNVVLVLFAAGLALALFGVRTPIAQLLLLDLVATVVTMVTFVVLLLRHARRPWAVPAGA
jgi:hypothetical protein